MGNSSKCVGVTRASGAKVQKLYVVGAKTTSKKPAFNLLKRGYFQSISPRAMIRKICAWPYTKPSLALSARHYRIKLCPFRHYGIILTESYILYWLSNLPRRGSELYNLINHDRAQYTWPCGRCTALSQYRATRSCHAASTVNFTVSREISPYIPLIYYIPTDTATDHLLSVGNFWIFHFLFSLCIWHRWSELPWQKSASYG